ncbi:MAG: hypothetical protein FVQ83_09775 [Chloroflexi bacterium]|nr:hypothetical protein [Chloroflexota bacterium]
MIASAMRLFLKERRILINIIFLVTFLFVLIPNGTTQAHSSVTRSKPSDGEIVDESPEVVQIWFELELDTFESSIVVLDSNWSRVDLDDSRVNTAERSEMVDSLSLACLRSTLC